VNAPEIAQLELLARVDELVSRLERWAEPDSPWEPMEAAQALVRRLLARAEVLRVRLESPLVVATFGGTGTGKSTLVNALVGRECTQAGRQRPTTTRPVLIAPAQADLESLGLPLDDFEVVTAESPLLRDLVIVDCPDPDTSEQESPGSNLERLRQLLPHCDVLIYTSTQQKYRSARVAEELGQAATGCRLLFVQTHADLDEDVRDDWRQQLSGHYDVPEMFFVDSLRALREQLAEQRPSGDFARLQELLTSHLAASQRILIRRANLVDLINAALERCRSTLAGDWQAVEQLEAALEDQRRKLVGNMADQLTGELRLSRNLWERRLIGSVTQIWGFSPFSSMLRLYSGLGNFVASLGLFRARNSAQMALIGSLQGVRWLKSRRQERDAELRMKRVGAFGLEDDALSEAQFVVAGYVKTARLDPDLANLSSLDRLRSEAARVEDQFLEDAGRRVDGVIDTLAERNSRLPVRTVYEVMFMAYVAFVLFRVGKNFFYDTFLRDMFGGTSTVPVPLLPIDFYISAGVFFLLWSGVLLMAFTRRLRRGLNQQIEELALELAQQRLSQGLFPALEQTCRDIESRRNRLEALAENTRAVRGQVARSPALGSQLSPVPEILTRRNDG